MRLQPRELHIFPAHPLWFNTEVVSANLRRKWGGIGGLWEGPQTSNNGQGEFSSRQALRIELLLNNDVNVFVSW